MEAKKRGEKKTKIGEESTYPSVQLQRSRFRGRQRKRKKKKRRKKKHKDTQQSHRHSTVPQQYNKSTTRVQQLYDREPSRTQKHTNGRGHTAAHWVISM